MIPKPITVLLAVLFVVIAVVVAFVMPNSGSEEPVEESTGPVEVAEGAVTSVDSTEAGFNRLSFPTDDEDARQTSRLRMPSGEPLPDQRLPVPRDTRSARNYFRISSRRSRYRS